MDALKKYWAFLSYSHQDAKVCEWLHQSLESFRVPRRLIGRDSREGKIEARLFPVFRDRDELPGSSELGKNLTEALAQSRYLIAICSPAAARSRWVNEEIRQFKMMGGEGRILALIIDGEPNATDKPNSGLLECFPEALKYRVDASGNLTSQRVEPIAADIRRGRESKSTALLRLIAGLLGVPFDELRQRDRERARRTMAIRAVVGVTLAAMLAGGLFWRYRQDRMERLEELGREALMQSQPTHAAVFLAETYRMGNDSRDVHIMLDQAMRSVDMLSAVHIEHPDGIINAAFSGGGTRLIATSAKGNVSIWRADNGRNLVSLAKAGSVEPVQLARFINDGREVALFQADGRVAVVKASDAAPLREANAPGGARLSVDTRQLTSGDQLLYTDRRGHTLVYDAARGEVVRELGEPCALAALTAQSIICTKASQRTLAGSANVYALKHNTLKDSVGPRTFTFPAGVVAVSALHNANRAVFALSSGSWQFADTDSGKLLAGATHPGGIETVQSSADGTIIATGGTTGSVLLWASATGQLVTQMQAHVGRVRALHFLAGDRRLASVGEDGTLKIWDTASGAMLSVNQTGSGVSPGTAMSPDGTRLATWATVGLLAKENMSRATLKVWDLAAAGPAANIADAKDLRERLFADRKAVPAAQSDLRCGGKLRRQVNADNSLSVIDAATGAVIANLLAGLDTADAKLDCDTALQWYLTGGKSGAAILWNATNAKPVARFAGHVRALEDVAFLPVVGEVMTFGGDGTAAKWTFEVETRNPGVISRRIACRVPLRLEGYLLRPNADAEVACSRR